jgi:hypothetical protein
MDTSNWREIDPHELEGEQVRRVEVQEDGSLILFLARLDAPYQPVHVTGFVEQGVRGVLVETL